MGFKLNKGGSSSMERPEDGSYMARVVGIVDLDHQPAFFYGANNENEIEAGYKIQIIYELPGQLTSEGKPFHVSEEVNNKTGERAKLTKRMEAFNVSNLEDALTKPVMVQVGSTAKGNAKIANVAPAMAGVPVGELENTPYMFIFDTPDLGMFEIMPKYIQRKVTKSLNFDGSELHRLLVDTDHDILKADDNNSAPF